MSTQHRAAAHLRWASVTDRAAATAKPRRMAEERWERLAREQAVARGDDPTDAQVAQMAASLRKAHFLNMAHKRWAKAKGAPR